jgi:rod shape-determining protein MreB
MDEAIMNYLKRECNLIIGRGTAENVKKDLATAIPLEEPRRILVRGINQLNTSAGTVQFTSTQANEAVREPCEAILKAVRWVLERTPPELCADIMCSGIHLTGSGSLLFALDQYIRQAAAYTGGQVKQAVALCFDTEYGFKSGRLQVNSALEALVIKLLNLREAKI